MLAYRTAFAAAIACALIGCQAFVTTTIGKGIGEKCGADGDCQGGSCFQGSCTAACAGDSECPAPSTCVASRCQLKGIGSTCAADGECQGGQCIAGICGEKCSTDVDCPSGTKCASGTCQVPLKAAFIYVGVPQDEGWTLTHEQGRQAAMMNLPYLQSDYVQNTFLPDDAKKAMDDFVMKGYDVVVTTSFSLREPTSEKANMYPMNKFLGCSTNVTGTNLGSYFGRMEQAYYLGGYAAGLQTKTKRLGFVGSYITPEVVRHINAFTLGAKAANPMLVGVEVRWVGFWFDTSSMPDMNGDYAETRLTKQLIDTGCDVIAHNMDNGRSVIEVEKEAKQGKKVWSVGNDNTEACSKGPTSCIGTCYWNWGPLYTKLLDDIHKGTWDPKTIIDDQINANPAVSTANFKVNQPVASNDIAIAIGQRLSDLAAPGNDHKEFEGPYCTNGTQRPTKCVTMGQTIDDDELHTMCWFVNGVIEKTDPMDPMSMDKEALVPPDCQTQQ